MSVGSHPGDVTAAEAVAGDPVGVLLAAGTGSRFDDGNKLLATVDGDPVVRRAAEPMVAAPLAAAVAVLGHESESVSEALAGLPIEVARNVAHSDGQATSVRTGVAWARERDAGAVVIGLGDMPWVDVGVYRALAETWRSEDPGIVVPEYDDRRGNPVLFDARHFGELLELAGDSGGRVLFERHPVRRVAVDDPGIHRDVDRPGDI